MLKLFQFPFSCIHLIINVFTAKVHENIYFIASNEFFSVQKSISKNLETSLCFVRKMFEIGVIKIKKQVNISEEQNKRFSLYDHKVKESLIFSFLWLEVNMWEQWFCCC